LIAGIPKAELIFNLVFFISISSVLLQGTTLSYVAKILHVTVPAKVKRRIGLDFETIDHIKSEMLEIMVTDNSKAVGKRILELEVPSTVNIIAIKRGGVYIVPTGSTRIQSEDIIYVLAEDERSLELLSEVLELKV